MQHLCALCKHVSCLCARSCYLRHIAWPPKISRVCHAVLIHVMQGAPPVCCSFGQFPIPRNDAALASLTALWLSPRSSVVFLCGPRRESSFHSIIWDQSHSLTDGNALCCVLELSEVMDGAFVPFQVAYHDTVADKKGYMRPQVSPFTHSASDRLPYAKRRAMPCPQTTGRKSVTAQSIRKFVEKLLYGQTDKAPANQCGGSGASSGSVQDVTCEARDM